MTGFLLLALAASLVLLVLEGAWLVRVPPEKYKTVIRRSIYIGCGIVVLGLVVYGDWHWLWTPVGIALLFGEFIQHYLFGNKATGRAPLPLVQYLTRILFPPPTGAAAQARRENASAPPPPRHDMSRDQARRILGLSPNATEQQIKEAHRRLMRRVHPDRGGSSQQAAQINRAKDVLLGG